MLRKHFNATTVIAIVALVFAMTGGAFAVSSKGGGSPSAVAAKKKAKKGKAKPKVKLIPGPKGATGPAGPAGPQGPAGPSGSVGEKGAAGPEGKAGVGTEGKAGASVIATPATKGECAEGGTKLEVQNSGKSEHVCNGKKGVLHPEETLPSGATETGAFNMEQRGHKVFKVVTEVKENPTTKAIESTNETIKVGNATLSTAISFPIPLGAPLTEQHVGVVATSGKEVDLANFTEVTPVNCLGSAAEPKANAGFLCIYIGAEKFAAINIVAPVLPTSAATSELTVLSAKEVAAGATGAVLLGTAGNEETGFLRGSWAVTAE